MLPPSFFQDVEKQHDYVVYSDTDSLYINIKEIKPKNIEEAIKISNQLSEEINNCIKNYMCNYLLPEMGISPNNNHTYFKTEIVASALLLLDVKKNYAYKMLAKENNILPKPKIKYVGIPIVRNDYSKFTQDMLKYIIEEIVMNESITNKLDEVIKYVKIMNAKMKECVDNLDIDYIGIPVKWMGRSYVKDTTALIGMKLFNTIVDEPVFKPLTSGKRLPIKITNEREFIQKLTPRLNKNKYYLTELEIEKFTNLCFHYSYAPDELKQILTNNYIEIDQDTLWDTLYSTTCRRIVEIIKSHGAKANSQ